MLPDLSLAKRSAVEENPNIDAEVEAALLMSYICHEIPYHQYVVHEHSSMQESS